MRIDVLKDPLLHGAARRWPAGATASRRARVRPQRYSTSETSSKLA